MLPTSKEIQQLGRAQDVDRLTELMADDRVRDSRILRQGVLTELEKRIGDERAIPALASLLESCDHEHLRFDAARILGRIGGRNAVAALRTGCSDPDEAVRARSYEALAEAGPEFAVDTLLEGLGDPSPAVRGQACRGLGKSGDPGAVPRLALMLRDESRSVRLAAADALAETGSQSAMSELNAAAEDAPFLEAHRLRSKARQLG